ncbi:MAG: LytR C-terminal domain-containing protein [Pseudomonadales bacterium]|jgi:hypothetical protein|nr:LytR C-terminal domain-containing protein [Pseudomonadales bacterium]
MYRYSIKKTASDNKKFSSRKIKVSSPKKNSSGRGDVRLKNASKPPSAIKSKSRRPGSHDSAKKNFKKKAQEITWSQKVLPDVLSALKMLLVVFVCGAVSVFIIVNTLSFFLPGFFRLTDSKSILFVTNGHESTPRLYFVHLNPNDQLIHIVDIDPNLTVNILGGFGSYPIRSLAPLLTLEQKSSQEILATYNFALGQIVDQVYFFDELPDLTQRRYLERTFFNLSRRHWQHYEEWPESLINAYFFVLDQIDASFNVKQLTNDTMASFRSQSYSNINLGDCSVVIINGTAQAGLAARVAGVLERNGFLVARLASATPQERQTVIYFDENIPACVELVDRVSRIFPQVPEVSSDTDHIRNYRVNAAIILGTELQD